MIWFASSDFFFILFKLFILCFYSFIFVISELVVFNHVELCRAWNTGFTVSDIGLSAMGKSPGKWIKTLLFGKKSSKSNFSKVRNLFSFNLRWFYPLLSFNCRCCLWARLFFTWSSNAVVVVVTVCHQSLIWSTVVVICIYDGFHTLDLFLWLSLVCPSKLWTDLSDLCCPLHYFSSVYLLSDVVIWLCSTPLSVSLIWYPISVLQACQSFSNFLSFFRMGY